MKEQDEKIIGCMEFYENAIKNTFLNREIIMKAEFQSHSQEVNTSEIKQKKALELTPEW